ATIELVYVVVREILQSIAAPQGNFVLSEEGLFGIFGLFLNVLIAVELIETVEVYFREHLLHAETVILVAIIAVARKAILLDLSKYDAATVAALAFLIVALGVAYFMVRRSCMLSE
ncbi:MAG: phosphate-starvation-inducible PsiE family protein, partial [Actinomycetota bacterium]|nr:phosphate-starvation-inducible PsiE family protein [Actinomycetota bacterium]